MRRWRCGTLCAFLGAALVFLVHAYRVYGTDVGLIDDAFIFFRYARHWAQGYGLVWNIGEPPVEGVSSLLYTGLLAVGVRLGLDIVAWATLLNLILALATLYLLTRYPFPFTRYSLLITRYSALILVSSPLWAFWTDTGMDTVLLTFLMVVAVTATLWARTRGRGWFWVGIAFALLGMARLDTLPLFLYTLVVLALWPGRTDGKGRWQPVRDALAGFLVMFVPFYAARWWYFGWPLPNTFYAKMGDGVVAWVEGLRYVGAFLEYPGVWALVVLALVGVAACPRWEVVFTAGWAGLLFVRAVAAGGDWMPYFRMMVPVLPWLSVLAALGLAALVARWRAGRWVRWGVVAALAVMVAWPSLRYVARRPFRLWRPVRLVEPMHASQYAMGLALREHLCPNDQIALLAAGAAAYLNDDHRIIDMLGLNDVHIAHSPPILYKGRWDSGHVRLDVDYLLARNPEWMQLDTHLFSSPEFRLRDWMPPQVLWGDPRVQARYDVYPLRVEVPTDFPRPRVGYIFFLHRKDARDCGKGK